MTKTPFFSIIIPTLNEEGFLPQILGDLINQEFQNFEVIVVDGYSDDKTIDKAKSFSKQLNLKIIVSPKRNLPLQRNLGAKNARGEYLIFFDADVSIPKNYLIKIFQTLQKQKVDYLTTWVDSDEKSFVNKMMMNTTNMFIEISKLIKKPFVCGGNAIIARDAFNKVKGYREELKFHEDYDLSVRLHQAGYKLFILKKPKFIVSLRRLRKDGTRKMIGKYAFYTAHFFLRGAPTSDIFKYDMGGQVYKQNSKFQNPNNKFNL